MNRYTQTAYALAIAAALAAPSFGQDKKDKKTNDGPAAQALEKVVSDRKEEAKRQGDRRVEVKEKAIWGLGELPPRLMSQAVEMLPKDPDKASLAVMQAANILELTASLGKDSSAESQALIEQAEKLRGCAMKIETRQVLSADQLREPFANAALAAAKYYQAAAARGLEMKDEEQTGYSLMGASAYLTAAHVFSEQKPTAEVSRAAYDAEIISTLIVKNSKATTVAGEQKSGENRGQDKQGKDGDQANLPEGTEQVVSNLKQAIEGTTVVAQTD